MDSRRGTMHHPHNNDIAEEENDEADRVINISNGQETGMIKEAFAKEHEEKPAADKKYTVDENASTGLAYRTDPVLPLTENDQMRMMITGIIS